MLLTVLFISCAHQTVAPKATRPMTQYFPMEASSGLEKRVLASIKGSRLDKNLRKSAHLLLSALRSKEAHITVQAGSLAAATAGYPGQNP